MEGQHLFIGCVYTRLLTFVRVGGIDFKVEIGTVTELGECDNIALHFKYRQAGAIESNLRRLFL
jgi:hypothetical protein